MIAKRKPTAPAAPYSTLRVYIPKHVIPLTCVSGFDQTCNADLATSRIIGKCTPDSSCVCPAGKDANGRCLGR
ncbi:MAG: hypothetical protein H6707_12385 [Deltaproteobacteria bacterium]|nr:hypothetical protein [Deltaproteobacteria bacterium]